MPVKQCDTCLHWVDNVCQRKYLGKAALKDMNCPLHKETKPVREAGEVKQISLFQEELND